MGHYLCHYAAILILVRVPLSPSSAHGTITAPKKDR
jgi:hypothetical protein